MRWTDRKARLERTKELGRFAYRLMTAEHLRVLMIEGEESYVCTSCDDPLRDPTARHSVESPLKPPEE